MKQPSSNRDTTRAAHLVRHFTEVAFACLCAYEGITPLDNPLTAAYRGCFAI